jgi:hypothetical protein
MDTTWQHDGSLWKGAVAGAAGGLLASWVMNQFQTVVGKITEKAKENDQHSSKRGDAESTDTAEGEDATVKAADRIARGVFHHTLSKQEKKVAGPAVHYAMGAVSGALYGAAAEMTPAVTMGAGLPFGTAVWLAADEIAVPAFGLSKPPTRYPAPVHLQALGAHLLYGLTTDLVRRGLRRAF